MAGALPFSLILVLSLSAMPASWGRPTPSPEVQGAPHSAPLPPGCCGAGAARGRGLGFLTPLLEEVLAKRSFRNGVGTGTKKNPFPRRSLSPPPGSRSAGLACEGPAAPPA